MSKIVQAVNAMISNKVQITNVIKNRENNEVFFLFKNKYKWSISEADGKYFLFFYPGSESIQDLARVAPHEWENHEMIRYSAAELGTKEAIQSFAELFTILTEKAYGIDGVLDDIIGDVNFMDLL